MASKYEIATFIDLHPMMTHRQMARELHINRCQIDQIAKELKVNTAIKTLLDLTIRLAGPDSDFSPIELDQLDFLQSVVDEMFKNPDPLDI